MQKLFEYVTQSCDGGLRDEYTQSCDGGLRDEYTERLHMKNK